MAKIVDLKKKFNHRWKSDPRFLKGFDYDHPKYNAVPDDLKWAIPLSEHQETQEFTSSIGYHEAAVEKKMKVWKKKRLFLKSF